MPVSVDGLRREVGLIGLLMLTSSAMWECGRIGFDVTDDAGASFDASFDRAVGPEASSDATDEAVVDPVDAATDATPDTGVPDAGCVPSAVADYCTAIPPLPAPPRIDGVLDCGPALRRMTPVNWQGPPPLPPFPATDATDLAVAWRPEGLYVFMAVTTPEHYPAELADPVFYGAGVELFVDSDAVSTAPPTYDNPGCLQLVVASPLDATTTNRRAEGFRNAADQGPWVSTQFGTFPTPTGFVFEGFLVGPDLGLSTWSLAAGATIGFDVSTDVSYTTTTPGPQGHREGQYFLHVLPPVGDASVPTTPYQDPRSFCAPVLTAR